MKLAEYLSRPDVSKSGFAERLGIARQYLHRLAAGVQVPSPKLAREIETATAGFVSRNDLRPDIWPPEVEEGS